MKHFLCLERAIPVAPLMDAVMRHPDLWNALADPAQIVLRNGTDCRDTEAMRQLQPIKRIALAAMNSLGASALGILSVQKIAPKQKIVFKPTDKSDPYSHYRLVLAALPGSLFLCGEETVAMEAGELWWVDARTTNAINNVTPDDVVHALIHLRHDN